MLNNLYIKNFILIDELNIDFENNFSAFTGETGAGKSIFIDSISCLIGEKFTTSYIKQGCQKATLEGTFNVDKQLKLKLEEAGYDSNCCIVTREIDINGKSTTKLNQRNTSVSFIKDLLSEEIDIHCQRDNQYLLNEKYHLRLLDQYCQSIDLLQVVTNKYKNFHDIEKQLDELENSTFSLAQLEIIQYQLEEIKALNINDLNEEENINCQLKLAANYEKMAKTLQEIQELFEDGVLTNLYKFTKIAPSLNEFDKINNNVENIVNCYYSINDDYSAIVDSLNKQSLDLSEIDGLNERLFTLQNAKRKYNTDLKGLVDLRDKLQEQLNNYSNRELVLDKLNKQKQQAYQEYMLVAKELSKQRKTSAKQLELDILSQLKDLSLEKAQFEVNFKPINPSSNGIDEVNFYISMNPGQPLMPLNKVASGGELSRLMLGLKVIFAKLQNTKLIIFDEIDTGVSGFVAFNIGTKMRMLGKDMQVFSVTHLSPVACCANNHYLISKYDQNNSTVSKLIKLDENEIIEQLAILSSSNTSQTALQAAKELYLKGQSL